MMRRVILILTLFLPLLGQGRPVYACSCAYDETLTEDERLRQQLDFEHNEIVFAGRVLSTKVQRTSPTVFSGGDPVYVTFEVDTVWKGDIAPEFTLTTAVDGAACGYGFVEGETYLVFVGDTFDDGSWNSNLCSGNVENPTVAQLAVLGDGYSPTANGTQGERIGLPYWSAVALFSMAFIGYRWTKRRQRQQAI